MTNETNSPVVTEVDFVLETTCGCRVFVAGTFNNWQPDVDELIEDGTSGIYLKTLSLELGRHEYKFIIDGNWVVDQSNPEFTANDLGTLNSVLMVHHSAAIK